MIAAVTKDVVTRGQLPTIILGDFNMPTDESTVLQNLFKGSMFFDARQVATNEFYSTPTCYVGPNGGSCIDYKITPSNLIDLVSNFKVEQLPVFKDHGLVSIQVALPAPIQTRCSLRSVPALPPLRSPTNADQRP